MKIDVNNDLDIAFGTSIQDIKVPEILRTRIPTGIKYFDAVIGGEGFTPSMVTLFTGTPGAGKTTMMLTLANGLQGRGAQVVFNTAEESLHQVKITAERLKLKHPFMVGGEDNVVELLKGCDKIRANRKYKDRPFFLIIDSLQCMSDGYFKSGRITTATAERSLQLLTNYAKEHHINIIVIGQVTKMERWPVLISLNTWLTHTFTSLLNRRMRTLEVVESSKLRRIDLVDVDTLYSSNFERTDLQRWQEYLLVGYKILTEPAALVLRCHGEWQASLVGRDTFSFM